MNVDLLSKILEEFHASVAEIDASAIFTVDGVTLVSRLSEGIDEDIVGAMGAALHSIGSRTLSELKRGAFEQALINGTHGCILVTVASAEAALILIAREEAKLALIFLEARRTAEAIARVLLTTGQKK